MNCSVLSSFLCGSVYTMYIVCISKIIVSALGFFAFCGIVGAQTNPLYEHRRARGAAPVAPSVLAVVVRFAGHDGVVRLDAPSARLLDDGVKSGDPVEIDLGTRTVRAYVGFSDEIVRAKNYYAQSKRQAPVEPGVTLVLDRLSPAEPIVLSSSAGGAVMHLGVGDGQRAVIRYARSRPRTDSQSR